MEDDKVTKILKLLDDIDGFASDSRGCYENARGNDSACYEATDKIRELLKNDPPTIAEESGIN